MVNPMLDSTGVAWVVVGTVLTGLVTLAILLATALFQEDETLRRRRRGRLPIVASTEEEARRRIRRLLLPVECLELEPDVPDAPAEGSGALGGLPRSSAFNLLHSTLSTLASKPSRPEVQRWRYVALKDDPRYRNGRTPLLIYVNVKSGGKQGVSVLRALQHLFPNEHQVVDLSAAKNPVTALYNFSQVPRFRVLCCGGDGTVASVLQMLDEVAASKHLLYKPPVGILPLGTGNDLARVLGWGGGYEGGDLISWLDAVAGAEVTLLDRWLVTKAPRDKGRRGSREPPEPEKMVMNNYFGIGVDAKISLGFHHSRETRPNLFSSRLVAKLMYASSGTAEILTWGRERAYAKLHTKLVLVCDGEEVPIPEGLEGIIVLNIPSYGGGCDLWKQRPAHGASRQVSDDEDDDDDDDSGEESGANGHRAGNGRARWRSATRGATLTLPQFERRSCPPVRRIPGVHSEDDEDDEDGSEAGSNWRSEDNAYQWHQAWGNGWDQWKVPSMSDRLMEVVGVNGVLHLGTTQIGIGGATRLAQCSELTIRTRERLPLQVDGEPGEFEPGEITISHFSQSFMLQHATDAAGISVAVDAVDRCMQTGVITAEQRNVLVREMARRAQRKRTVMTRNLSQAALHQSRSMGVLT